MNSKKQRLDLREKFSRSLIVITVGLMISHAEMCLPFKQDQME